MAYWWFGLTCDSTSPTWWLAVICLTTCCPNVDTSECEMLQNSNCHCRDSDGFEVDLSPIVQNIIPPAFNFTQAKSDSYMYAYNPCKAFGGSFCSDAAVCQSVGNNVYFNIGSQSTSKFKGDVNHLELIYTSDVPCDENKRISTIKLICSKSETFTAQGEDPKLKCSYHFELETPYACPIKKTHGISVGSILLIVFFVLVFIYIVGGILILRYRYEARGVEQIPNLAFWLMMPGLIKDGCVFTFQTLKNCCSSRTSYESV